jgi:hypothetical protein
VHAVDAGSVPAKRPATTGYLVTGAVTFAIAALELLLVYMGAPGAKQALVPLLAADFVVAALFYQGLWYERPMYKVIMAIGVFFGLFTFLGLVLMLGLGTLVRP